MDGVYALCRNRSGALVVERLSPGWSVVVGVRMCVCVCFIYPHRGGRKENPLIIREAPKFLYPCHPCSHLPASASRKGEPSSQRPLLQRHNCHHTPAAATQTTLIPSPHHQSLHSPRRRSPDHARHFPLPLHSRTTPTNAGHNMPTSHLNALLVSTAMASYLLGRAVATKQQHIGKFGGTVWPSSRLLPKNPFVF